jgi:phosphoadenosine phosphosulfate reductase
MDATPQFLHDCFQPLTPEERIEAMYQYFAGEEVLLTSSFGIHSALLLQLVSQVNPDQPVHFINTRFHFEETLAYKDRLTQLLNLRVEALCASSRIHTLTIKNRLWEKHPDSCCRLNKVQPLAQIKPGHKVWISGLMAFQTPHRAHLRIFEASDDNETTWRFYPLIDLNESQYENYRRRYALPLHPLQENGYGSVGCRHCTVRDAGRHGRWKGSEKTECGLHLRHKPI